ncbi:hypothetical protein GCM10007276_14580 [Agaricicola taiwanensis]|uniref:ODP domain-containing protein n=1 Tax=Agaricicola taiwanensis TaxID=591372 RepID=A0A8J2VMA4_9RHOB|nr:hypothetical protein [Agaricicola taiwanensis]GGE38256.1 hypothetical protein GCM10007276_14580 [Agaricicola taiwanensis]
MDVREPAAGPCQGAATDVTALPGHRGGTEVFSFADPTLFRLGDTVPLDGRISWAPRIEGHFQPINCYLVKEGSVGYLIDTGVAAHRQRIIDQLRRVDSDIKEISIFFTRAELDCSGNFASLYKTFNVTEVISGAIRNPFDSYDELSKLSNTEIRRQNLPLSGVEDMQIGSSSRLRLIPAHIRMLTTYWAYDSVSKTLFSSDVFGHTSCKGEQDSIILDEEAADHTTINSVGAHLLEKFGWMALADNRYMRNWVEKLFADYDIEHIAPTHGCIISGKRSVMKHLSYLMDALDQIGLKEQH